MSLDLGLDIGNDGPLPVAEHLMYAFGSFRPSERILLSSILKRSGGEQLLLEAFELFMEVWANSDWLEEYNVEKVAIWMSVNGTPGLLAGARRLSEYNSSASEPNRKLTYTTFLNELNARLPKL